MVLTDTQLFPLLSELDRRSIVFWRSLCPSAQSNSKMGPPEHALQRLGRLRVMADAGMTIKAMKAAMRSKRRAAVPT